MCPVGLIFGTLSSLSVIETDESSSALSDLDILDLSKGTEEGLKIVDGSCLSVESTDVQTEILHRLLEAEGLPLKLMLTLLFALSFAYVEPARDSSVL